MPITCLVVGNGVIGRHLQSLSNSTMHFMTTQKSNPGDPNFLDLSQPISESNVIFGLYDYVVIAAGISGEINCRKNLEMATLVNVKGTLATITEGIKNGCKIVFISSSYLSGVESFPNRLKDLFPYTHHKWVIENKLKDLGSQHMILRPGKVIHSQMKLFETISKNQSRNLMTEVNSNYFFSTTSINKLGSVTLKLLMLDYVGDFNLVAESSLSFFELAVYWCSIMGYSVELLSPKKEAIELRDTSKSQFLSALDLKFIGDRQESILEIIGSLK